MDLTLTYHTTPTSSSCSTLVDHVDRTHPNITCFTASLHHPTPSTLSIGSLKGQLLHKSRMSDVKEECFAYDATHAPEAKLHKVGNYLSNESFETEEDELVRTAEWVFVCGKGCSCAGGERQGAGVAGGGEVGRGGDGDGGAGRVRKERRAGHVGAGTDRQARGGSGRYRGYG